jgi:hypothetical protein
MLLAPPGAGLLIGVAFLVIIPEGISLVYEAQEELHSGNATTTTHHRRLDDDHDHDEESAPHILVRVILFLCIPFKKQLSFTSWLS